MSTAVVMSVPEKKALIRTALEKRTEELAALLPPDQAESAPRLINIAILYFGRDPKLHNITPASFIQCVFDSVSSGIPLDGKLGHAVAFNCKVRMPDGKEVWEKQVKFMPDYKGIVAVARRTGQIEDAQHGIVCENDHWRHGRMGPQLTLEHVPADSNRGEMKGVYCVLTFDGGGWNYEYMTKAEVDKVRASSKAKDDGPWVDWYDQMARKTVLKRALKTYCDDPQLLAAIDADNDWHDIETGRREPRVQRSTISAATLPRPGAAAAIASAVTDQHEQRAKGAALQDEFGHADESAAGTTSDDDKGPSTSATDEEPAAWELRFAECETVEHCDKLLQWVEANMPAGGERDTAVGMISKKIASLKKKPTQRELT